MMPPMRPLRPTVTAMALALALAASLAGVGCATSGGAQRAHGRVTLVEPTPEDDPYVIPRARWEAALKRGPAWVLQQVPVRAVVHQRHFVGFQVLGLFPDEADIQVTGLRLGDVVQRVNGSPVERPDQFMKIWKALPQADHLTVQFLRRSQPLEVTWRIE